MMIPKRPSIKVGGYQCPKCKTMESKILYTSAYGKEKYRERVCKTCEHRYITSEVVVDEGTGT